MRFLPLLSLGLVLAPLGAAAQSCNVVDDVVYYNFRGELRVMHPLVQTAACGPGAVTRTASSGGGVVVRQSLPVVINGATVPMEVSRSISAGAIARGAARAMGGLGLAISIVDAANLIRCRRQGGQSSSILYGSLECDMGVPVQSGTSTSQAMRYQSFNNGDSPYTQTEGQVLAQCQAYAISVNPEYGCIKRAVQTTGGQLQFSLTYQGNLAIDSWTAVSGRMETVSEPGGECPGGTPVSTLGGIPFCASGTYTPQTVEQVGGRVAAEPSFADRAPGLVGDLMGTGAIPANAPGVGPSVISGPSSSTGQSRYRSGTGTGGGTWQEVSIPVSTITYPGDNTFDVTQQTTTTRTDTAPDGSTTTTTTTTTEGPGANSQGDVITCGLPNTPPCKIDERGTPTDSSLSTAREQMDARGAEAVEKVEEQTTARPLPWLWGGVTLPAGSCSDMAVESPHPAIPNATVNICTQPWVEWWRAALAWVAGLWTVGYCWRRFADTAGA